MSKICSIMQPTYLPWIGYFNLIHSSDFFVFLDDVQFSKQSWQNRNKILIKKKIHWLTIPVIKKRLEDRIYQIKIDDTQKWRKKHIKSIKQNYFNHKYFNDLEIILELINDKEMNYLLDLNISIIKAISGALDIKSSKFLLSSKLNKTGSRSEKLLKIIKELNCDVYLSPEGSRNYIESDLILKKSGIKIVYQNFKLKKYEQKNSINHISHLSVIDIIANIGLKNCKKFIKG